MKKINMKTAAVAISSILVVLSGCSGAPVSVPSVYREASWARTYDSYDEVVEEATLVVTGTAIAQKHVPSVADGSGPTDTTLTTFSIANAHGAIDKSATEILVRSSDGFDPTEVAYYEIGATYMLFLEPFEFQKGRPTGTYIAVGQLAAYRVSGSEAVRTTRRDALPSRVPAGDLQRVASAVAG